MATSIFAQTVPARAGASSRAVSPLCCTLEQLDETALAMLWASYGAERTGSPLRLLAVEISTLAKQALAQAKLLGHDD
jgi:hypothetical protein